jgi:hypothetical protein
MRPHLAALVFAVAACSTATGVQTIPAFTEAATTSVLASGSERSMYASLAITNVSLTTQTLSWGFDCSGAGALRIRAYRATGGAHTLVWDSDKVRRQLGCLTQLVQRVLNPGDAATIAQYIPVASILGDSLPAGSYDVTITAETTPVLSGESDAGATLLSNAVVDPPIANLNGTWTGAANGVSISVALTWTADSVTGAGTYTASATNTLGCGGGNLRGTGTMTLAGTRDKDHIQARTSFNNGEWVPPFSAVLIDATTLGGSFMSIDAGPCPITRSEVPRR